MHETVDTSAASHGRTRSSARFVSVIIPTHNRLPLLQRVLHAISLQTYPHDAMEVVVAADGCTDNTEAIIRSMALPTPLKVVALPGAGAAAARNAGANIASGDLLVFIDDDVVPSPNLVAAHAAAHSQHPEAAVIGPYVLPPETRPTPFGTWLRQGWDDQFRAMAESTHKFTYRDILGGNLSIPMSLFTRTGGFDATFQDAGGEDIEFGVRLLQAGARIAYAPNARARHEETMTFERTLRRARILGTAQVKIARLHPQVRDTLAFHRPSPIRFVLGRSPVIARVAVTLARAIIGALERSGVPGAWRPVARAVQHYWYWVGVADELGSYTALARLPASLDEAARSQ